MDNKDFRQQLSEFVSSELTMCQYLIEWRNQPISWTYKPSCYLPSCPSNITWLHTLLSGMNIPKSLSTLYFTNLSHADKHLIWTWSPKSISSQSSYMYILHITCTFYTLLVHFIHKMYTQVWLNSIISHEKSLHVFTLTY